MEINHLQYIEMLYSPHKFKFVLQLTIEMSNVVILIFYTLNIEYTHK